MRENSMAKLREGSAANPVTFNDDETTVVESVRESEGTQSQTGERIQVWLEGADQSVRAGASQMALGIFSLTLHEMRNTG